MSKSVVTPLPQLEGLEYGGRMEDSSGWSVRRTKLEDSFSVLLRMLKEKNKSCFFQKERAF